MYLLFAGYLVCSQFRMLWHDGDDVFFWDEIGCVLLVIHLTGVFDGKNDRFENSPWQRHFHLGCAISEKSVQKELLEHSHRDH